MLPAVVLQQLSEKIFADWICLAFLDAMTWCEIHVFRARRRRYDRRWNHYRCPGCNQVLRDSLASHCSGCGQLLSVEPGEEEIDGAN